MTKNTARRATRETYDLAEGPVWDHVTSRLLWVDIPTGNVHVGVIDRDVITPIETHHVDRTVGAVAAGPTGMLVAGHHAVWLVTPTSTTIVAQVIPDGQRRRLNDGKCDPAGRFLVGSLSLGAEGPEALYAVDLDRGVTLVDDDVQMSNGLAWSPSGDHLYSVDTTRSVVWVRSYDTATGRTGPRRKAFHVSGGLPDGMCADVDGNLWIAVWGAGQVRHYTPEGRQLGVIEVAAPHTSCVAFVGPNLDRLVITTARADLTAAQTTSFPGSGALFLATVDRPGQPVTRSAITSSYDVTQQHSTEEPR